MQDMFEILNKITNISPVFYQVLYMTLLGSLVGILVYFIRNIFDKKISGKSKCVMWWIVLATLLIPIRFELKTSKQIVQNNVVDKFEQIKYISQESYDLSNIQEETDNLENQKLDNINTKEILPDNTIVPSNSNNVISKQIYFKNIILNAIIPCVWLLGTCLFILIFISGNIKINSYSKKLCKDERANEILKECKKRLHINKNVKLILQRIKNIPSIYGIVSPSILITEKTLEESDSTIKYIFLHELSHYKRKDILFNYILLIVLSIHWFNPIVWFLFNKIRQDIEVATDELASKGLSKNEKKEYGMVLINLLRNNSKESYTSSMLCMSDTGKNMERRIIMMKGKSKIIILSVLIASIVSGIIAGFVFIKVTNPITNEEENFSTENIEKNYQDETEEKEEFYYGKNKVTEVGNLNLQIESGSYFSDGLAWIADANNECFYIDKQGNKIIEGKNGEIGSNFKNGLSSVVKDIGNNRNHIYKYGYINKNGDIAIDLIYDSAFEFIDGLAPVKKDGKSGYIDTKGNWVLDAQGEGTPNYFSEGLAGVFKNGKYGFIDKNGNTVIDFQYDTGSMFLEGLAWVEKDGKDYYIDKQGNIVIDISSMNNVDIRVDEANSPSVFSDGLAQIYQDGKYKYIDKQGNIALEVSYEKAGSFTEGLTWAYKDGKYGFIDKNGNTVIDFQYDTGSMFLEGLACVSKNGKVSFINYDGTVIIGNIK